MLDHAGPIRAKLIAATPADTPLDIKRRAAIAYLGENWIHHPDYQFRPRHSFSVAARQPHSVLRPVQMTAQLAGRV
jgi:hypothetical protein